MARLLEERVDPQEETPDNANIFSRKDHRIKAKHDQDPSAAVGTTLDKDLRKYAGAHAKSSTRAARRTVMAGCAVFDPAGAWMSQWHRQFAALGIPFLRSPISAHPDPVDGEMMRVFAEDAKRREAEMIEVDLRKVAEYHGPYEVPSTVLFKDFCDGVISRYKLGSFVQKARVTRIRQR
eukprot:g4710.t1